MLGIAAGAMTPNAARAQDDAKKEDVKPDQTQLDAQVAQLLEQYKDADKHRVEIYVASVMTNEAVMKMLESL